MKRTPLRRSPGTVIPLAVRRQVHDRDQGCVGERAGLPHECDRFIEQDHVLNGGMGYKGPSTIWNLVELCRTLHRWKTENTRIARPKLVRYIERVTPEYLASVEPQKEGIA